MPGNKQKTKYKLKRKNVFAGRRKQEIQDGGDTEITTNIEPQISPKKRNKSEEKLNRSCPLIQAELTQTLTRNRAVSLGLLAGKNKVKVNSFKIIDAASLQTFLTSSAICSSCKSAKGKLKLWQDDSKKKGLKETLFSVCSHCSNKVYFDTSQQTIDNRHAEVNVRCIQAGLATGNGLSNLQNICGILNLPKPVTSKNYNNTLKLLSQHSVAEADSSMQNSVAYLKEVMQKDGEAADADRCYHVSVTLDGTWQKRYGFNSLLGVVFLISVLTGEVLDYVVKSKVCFECKSRNNWDKASKRYTDWYETHQNSCTINHTTSAESMEKTAAVEMFNRSVDTRGLKYTTYIGDGDSSSFNVVREAMYTKYKDGYVVSKEDCVGHIQKRMGKGLRTFKNSKKVLGDGIRIGGSGRLTDALMDKIQNYYGAAIRNNPGNLQNMENAVWAIYYHCIIENNESLAQQHHLCPIGASSWCRYQLDVANGTRYYDQTRCLPAIFRSALLPLFTRLSKPELLKRCLKGLTQNQNEAINAILWKKCPKTVFVGHTKLVANTAQTVAHWNQGSASSSNVLKRMGVGKVGINAARSFRLENSKRIVASAQKISTKYKRQRQQNRQNRKRKRDEKSYMPGGFDSTVKAKRITKKITKKSKNTVVLPTVDAIAVDDIEIDMEINEGTIIQLTFIDELTLETPVIMIPQSRH